MLDIITPQTHSPEIQIRARGGEVLKLDITTANRSSTLRALLTYDPTSNEAFPADNYAKCDLERAFCWQQQEVTGVYHQTNLEDKIHGMMVADFLAIEPLLGFLYEEIAQELHFDPTMTNVRNGNISRYQMLFSLPAQNVYDILEHMSPVTLIFISQLDSRFRAFISGFKPYWKCFGVETLESFQVQLREDILRIAVPLPMMLSRKTRIPYVHERQRNFEDRKVGLQQYVNIVSKSLALPLQCGELSAAKENLKHLQRLEYASNFENLNYRAFTESVLQALPEWLAMRRWELICDGLAFIPTIKSSDKKAVLHIRILAKLINAFPLAVLEWVLESFWNWVFS